MSETLLQTKLFMPPLRPRLVPRPRLLRKLDAGAIGRLLLPGMIRFNRETSDEVFAQICDLLEVHDQASLADGFEIFLRDLPLPTRLSDMGIGPVEIDRAATLALSDHAISDNPRSLSRENLLNILEPVL